MLIFSMGVSADGFVTDRDGGLEWTAPDPELFRFHVERTGELGGHLLGRRLYETMLVWETDPALREGPAESEFADIWRDLPKVVFSRTLDHVQGSARLAERSLAEEAAALREATEKDIAIGGADLAAQAIGLGLVEDFQLFRYPVLVGAGTPFLAPVAAATPLELVETRTFGSGVVYEHYQSPRLRAR